MATIQIKNVDDRAHATLRRRASAAGMSLQEYLRTRLEADAATPTLEEVLARAEARRGGDLPLDLAVEMVRADRAER